MCHEDLAELLMEMGNKVIRAVNLILPSPVLKENYRSE